MRSLKRQVKEIEKKLLAENADNYDALVKEHFPESAKTKSKPFGLFSAIGATVLALSLCLMFLLPTVNNGFYSAADEVIVSSSAKEVDSSVKGVRLAELADYEYLYTRVYDSKSNDTLYYLIYISSGVTYESVSVRLYVNKHYTQRQTVSEFAVNGSVGDFNVSYDKSDEWDEDLYSVYYDAEIKLRKATVFIDYEQMSLDGSDNFVNFFSQSFKKK